MKKTFDILLLIARPAAGKSEVIKYLKQTGVQERIDRFHVGRFEEIDDFPMLWAWFEEDELLAKAGRPRLHTDENNYFKYPYLWNVLIERICLEYQKLMRDKTPEPDQFTAIIEFSRGKEHGGYKQAFQHLCEDVLKKAAILYIDVPWEESLRKNRRRFNPDRPDSILEHGLEDEKLERLYKETDWEEISAGDPAFIQAQGFSIPYAVMNNEDDVTTSGGELLGKRLEETLKRLWEHYQNRPIHKA